MKRTIERRLARWRIIQLANQDSTYGNPYSMRRIQKAVHHVRAKGLAPKDLLTDAGYNRKNPR